MEVQHERRSGHRNRTKPRHRILFRMENTVTDTGYINPALRPERGRKYWNHMAKHSPGVWHRHRLLASGLYIKTSDPNAYRKSRWQVVGKAGPELAAISTPPTRTPWRFLEVTPVVRSRVWTNCKT